MNLVKKPDGTIGVDDHVEDGEVRRFSLQMMDEARHRPGYRDADRWHDADAAFAEYIDHINNAWRGERREREPQVPRDLADAERMRDEAYREGVEQMCNAWRTR
jgi:hypothetical protein